MTTPIPITLVGATGLTGAATLNALLQTKSNPFTITTIARKAINPLPASHPSTTYSHNLVADLFDAPYNKVAEKEGIYASCLGTTRAAAGSLAAQEKLDLDLNRDLAKRAKADGASTLILVSSGGSSSSSWFPYSKMKGKLEDAVKEMDFEHCIILRPGLLLGARNETRGPEYATQVLFKGFRGVGLPMGKMCIEGDDVGACIAQLAAHQPTDKVITIGNNEMIELAKKWKAANGQA